MPYRCNHGSLGERVPYLLGRGHGVGEWLFDQSVHSGLSKHHRYFSMLCRRHCNHGSLDPGLDQLTNSLKKPAPSHGIELISAWIDGPHKLDLLRR